MAAETARKWLHLAPGVLALAVRDLGYLGSLGLTLALLAFNLWLLPRLGGGRLWRPAERLHGAAPGILFYPVALVILAVATRGRPEVLAGAWGMLACGDAAATLAGRRWGRRRLPWNEAKSWVGSAAFLFVSWAVIAALVAWTAPGRYGPSAVLAAAALAALAGAVVESLPWTLDDNLSVTLVGGGALYIGLGILAGNRGFAPAAGLDWSVALLVLLALLALVVRAVDVRGALTGLAVASGVWLGTGWRGLVMLALFVGLGTAASRLRRRWAGAGGVEPARGVANVLANGAVAGTCGLLAAWQEGEMATVAMVGALAAATADTVGGEIGRAFGGRTRRITDGREVEPGADGGVSWAGTTATASAALAVAATASVVGLLDVTGAVIVALVGMSGALLDSVLGATLERRGLLDNEAVNFLCTLASAWLAAQFVGTGA